MTYTFNPSLTIRIPSFPVEHYPALKELYDLMLAKQAEQVVLKKK